MRNIDCIITDEISMLNRDTLEYLDRLLRELCWTNEPFGGKFVVIGKTKVHNVS